MIDVKKQREENQQKSQVGKQQLLQKMRRKEKLFKQEKPQKVMKKKVLKSDAKERQIQQKELQEAYIEIQKLKQQNSKLRRKNKLLRQEKQQQKDDLKIQQSKWEISFKERVIKKEKEFEEREQYLSDREAYAKKLVDLGWDEESAPLYELKKRDQYIEKLNRYMQRVNDKMHQVNKMQRQYDERVHQWKQRIDVLERRIERLENQKQQLKDEIAMSDRRYSQLEQRYRKIHQSCFYGNSVNDILSQLIHHLSKKTIKQFYNLSVLNECYQQIFKQMNGIENSLYYGFIEKDEADEGWLFHDMNQQVQLKLVYQWQFNEAKLKPGAVVKIEHLEDDTALLLEIYPEMVRRSKPKITKAVKKATSVERSARLITGENNPEVRQWLSKLVITVIGNRYLDSFIQSIQRVVKKVEVIDAYESSQQQVDSAIKHSDYTFIDTGSVPHSVMDALKRLGDELGEIQLFYQPKDNDGVARLRYLYWKMQGGHK